MALLKRFREFLLRNSIQNQDYVVGYDGNTGNEIRIKASALQGAAGASAEIQFSSDQSSWHYPIVDGDLYIRIRTGNGAWNVARFVVDESILPELAAVATSGDYNDLENLPTEFAAIQNPDELSEFNSEEASLEYVLCLTDNGYAKISLSDLASIINDELNNL